MLAQRSALYAEARRTTPRNLMPNF